MLREGVRNDSSSSRADAFLLRLGVAGTEGGGVGIIDSDGMILYSPSFDRKSCDLLARYLCTCSSRSYRNTTISTYTRSSDNENLV